MKRFAVQYTGQQKDRIAFSTLIDLESPKQVVLSGKGNLNSQKIEKEAGKPVRNRLTISAWIVSL